MDEELNNLIRKLRDESSFVQSEKKHLVELYRQLLKKSEQLFNKQWLIGKQHLILEDLIMGRNKYTITQCCNKYSLITDKTQFLESYKTFGHNDYYVSEFLKGLRDKPKYLSKLIVKSEKYSATNAIPLINGVDNKYFSPQQLIPIAFRSLYGNCILKKDENLCLDLLKHLIELQFGNGDQTPSSNNLIDLNATVDLRRLIRKQSCSFNILFKLYTSFAYSAQLFLAATLYDPITQILTGEWFLDVDPDKALARFSAEEIASKFGQPNSKEYKAKTLKYREKIVNELYNITMSFIDSINSNLFCFPSSLTWLVGQLFAIVSKSVSKNANKQDIARKLCCDLVMALYICPAICDPESYGVISDVQMSPIARHNLMQIANILQVLAMSDDDKDLKAQDLYSKFRNNCVSDILNNIISTNRLKYITGQQCGLNDSQFESATSNNNLNGNSIEIASNFSSASSYFNSSQMLLSRISMLISLQDVHKLIIYLRQINKEQLEVSPDNEETKWLKSILPLDYMNQALETALTAVNVNQLNILNANSNSLNHVNNKSNKPTQKLAPNPAYSIESPEIINHLLKEAYTETNDDYMVSIFSISDKDLDCPGMLSEEKVLNECESSGSSSVSLFIKTSLDNKVAKNSTRDQRHIRKSNSKCVCHKYSTKSMQKDKIDDVDPLDSSFGGVSEVANTMNNIKLTSDSISGVDKDEVRSRHDGSVEGISEACETNDCHSLSSNDEDDENGTDDNQNPINDDDQLEADRLSDFDNFSGRDTPIISGRDSTPSSHSQEDLHNTSSSRNINNSNNANTTNQNSNSYLNENTTGLNSNINNINNTRGPQLLPVTVQKANREDINDKFCKFELNKMSAPVKEEQLSETGWSLDADPPESVNNEPINDRLGLDENPMSNNRANPVSNTSILNTSGSLIPLAVSNSNTNPTLSHTGASANNLIQSNSFTELPAMLTTNQTSGANIVDTSNDNDPNLDDRYSVVSDSAAWSTDLINNSDSDFESNSPSKYTPYSTYSSNCSSSHHPLLNQSLLTELSSANTPSITPGFTNINNNNNLQQQPTPLSSNTTSNLINSANSASTATANSDTITKQSFDSGLTSWNYSSSSGNLNLMSNTNTNTTTSQNGSCLTNTPSLNQISEPIQQTTSTSQSTNNLNQPNSTHKSGLSSLFSRNSGSVKFSITSTINDTHKKTSKLNAILNNISNKTINKTPTNNNNINKQTSDPSGASAIQTQSDNIDSILRKYTNKNTTIPNNPIPVQPVPTTPAQGCAEGQLIDLGFDNSSTNAKGIINNFSTTFLPKNASSNSLQSNQNENSLLYFDPNNLEQSKPFLDAKKKLRIVLGWSDGFTSSNFIPSPHLKKGKETFLIMYLKTQLYDAISLQDKEKEAQLFETMRCVSIFNEQECHKLLRSLKKDYVRRISYLTYLTKSKQNILNSLNLIDKLLRRTEWHQKLCTHHLASVVARMYLETKENENQMFKFLHDFRQLVAVDEKFELFKKFIQLLKKEYDAIWTGCQEEMIQLGYLCLERLLLSKVYRYVMYPNGEVDYFRDTKVSECFNELANVITPSHPLIGIPAIYQNECPWTAAQMELKRLNIYKTPQDKLTCIRKCMLAIQNLLAIAKSPVCADDLHPVLIYVIIKANPHSFLSNVQYIEGFYGKQLESEDYYWAQFIFAFSYIKANMLTKIN